MDPTQFAIIAAMALGSALYAFYAMRKVKADGAKQMQLVPVGVERLHAHIQMTRRAGESDPTCVVAYHYEGRTFQLVFVGVTNERIVVIKDEGQPHEFPYDDEGEHLPAADKEAQGRGFFSWRHSEKMPDGRSAYTPDVKKHPPFSGEEWQMFLEVPGHPAQRQSLEAFSRIFYFKWFY